MKVLTYVNGEITVINGDYFYRNTLSKPLFITGNNFYYEPTLKKMDGVELNSEQILKAEEYITNFVEPIVTKEVLSVKYYVDLDGNYLGNNGVIEVPTAPMLETEKWDGSKWVDSVLIDKATKYYKGIGDTRITAGTIYAPNTLMPEPFDITLYFWNGIGWDITLDDAKNCKKSAILAKQLAEIDILVGSVASGEVASFSTQEDEARAWTADNTVATPFIDSLLLARANGETKQQLVNKIIVKADAYTVAYASMLGKFQRLIKQVQGATTINEVKAIVW